MEDTVKEEEEVGEMLVCRTCLATDVKLFSITELQLEEAFYEVTGKWFHRGDNLPQYICSYCRARLQNGSDFKELSIRAQDLLKQMLQHRNCLTTDDIRTIDRISNRLCLPLSINTIDQKPIEFIYDEDVNNDIYFTEDTDTHIEDNLLDNYNDNGNDSDNPVIEDVLIKVKDEEPIVEIEEEELPTKVLRQRTVNVKSAKNIKSDKKRSVKSAKNIVSDKKLSVKRVKNIKGDKKLSVKRVKNIKGVKKLSVKHVKNIKCDKNVQRKVVKEREVVDKESDVKQKFKIKKGFKRFFSCEDDYIKFEQNYNISIVKVSEEEQRKDMEARKLSANYARAHVRCDKCFKGFLSEGTFENHQKVHDPSMGANECHLCFARFKHPTRLRRHMETHTLKFICKLCPLVTRHRGMAMMHSDFHSGKTFECKYCGQTFKKKTTFNTHIRVQHPLENASRGACDVCGETFIGRRGLQQHKTMAHRKRPIPELQCAACGVQFESLDAVVRHAAAACDPALRPCPQCGDTFADDAQLDAHAASAHVAKVYLCDECDKSFATRSSLGTHVDRVHLRIKPRKAALYSRRAPAPARRVEEICEVCGKGYPSSTWLKYHQRTHTGERPYKCTECPKSYMTPAALHSHSVSHTGVRRWQCSQCPKTFLHQSSIYKHKLVHTGEKPFSCHICHKAFTQSGSLATHVKYVHLKLPPPPRRRRAAPV